MPEASTRSTVKTTVLGDYVFTNANGILRLEQNGEEKKPKLKRTLLLLQLLLAAGPEGAPNAQLRRTLWPGESGKSLNSLDQVRNDLRTLLGEASVVADRLNDATSLARDLVAPPTCPAEPSTRRTADREAEDSIAVPTSEVDGPPVRAAPLASRPSAYPTGIPQYPFFRGRADELAALHAAFFENAYRVPRVVVALVAPGGLGKTALAAEFARKEASEFPGGMHWLDAGGAGTAGGLVECLSVWLARLLPTVPRPVSASEAAARLLGLLINDRRVGDRGLLVLDNLEHRDGLTFIARTFPEFDLLITTRESMALDGLGTTVITLRGLCPADAERISAGSGVAFERIRSLCERVEYHALAVCLISAAAARQPAGAPSHWMTGLLARSGEEGRGPVGHVPGTVADCFDSSIRAIRRGRIRSLLVACASLPSTGFSLALADHVSGGLDLERTAHGLDDLKSRGVLGQVELDRWVMHRLLRDFIRATYGRRDLGRIFPELTTVVDADFWPSVPPVLMAEPFAGLLAAGTGIYDARLLRRAATEHPFDAGALWGALENFAGFPSGEASHDTPPPAMRLLVERAASEGVLAGADLRGLSIGPVDLRQAVLSRVRLDRSCLGAAGRTDPADRTGGGMLTLAVAGVAAIFAVWMVAVDEIPGLLAAAAFEVHLMAGIVWGVIAPGRAPFYDRRGLRTGGQVLREQLAGGLSAVAALLTFACSLWHNLGIGVILIGTLSAGIVLGGGGRAALIGTLRHGKDAAALWLVAGCALIGAVVASARSLPDTRATTEAIRIEDLDPTTFMGVVVLAGVVLASKSIQLLSKDWVHAHLSAAATLTHADLRGADLSDASLAGACLGGCIAASATFRNADLSAANLARADLTAANLSAANLRGARLCCADLSRADLAAANLEGATCCPRTRWPEGGACPAGVRIEKCSADLEEGLWRRATKRLRERWVQRR